MKYPRLARLKTKSAFDEYLQGLGLHLPCEEKIETGPSSPWGKPLVRKQGTIGNRFCILPMEGWDGTKDGNPTELTKRRWGNFGLSGAKLVWGGEAVAVRHDGRANPNQLLLIEENLAELEGLHRHLLQTHQERFGTTEDLYVGLQLTHSGRFARPNQKALLEPRTVYRHPYLDPRFGVDANSALLSDDELSRLIDDFVKAAVYAKELGFAFVDIKHCHGYLGHELLSGFDRPGKFGGSFENRTRFLQEIVAGIQAEAPGLEVGVRLSIFDFVPYRGGEQGVGEPEDGTNYAYAFGGDHTGQGIDLHEPHQLMELMKSLGIQMVCTTAGSPYYNPHIQRPASYPPSDGYQPPEDPTVGVARQIQATSQLKQAHPEMIFVGSGYSYLQEWLPLVGQGVLREEMADLVGLGRMVLSYPELPADVLADQVMKRNRICRTFSDCTTGPRNGMVSGCFPIDPFYKKRPEREQIAALKKTL
ncbi:NADPH dehydrogenase [Planctomycetales bacterium 10988]|nr:NADPH dehydrogenase [Planctomycetales bacterium 10988]